MRKIDKIFNPSSIAIIGASDEEGSVGFGLVKNVLIGKKERKIYLVNPFKEEIEGIKCYKKIEDIKSKVDLALIAVPAGIVIDIAKECCNKKVNGIVVISSGFSETGEEGLKRENELKKIVKDAQIPLIGPNCLGIINPSNNLNASFSPVTPNKGNIAFLSQSGALLDSVMERSFDEGIGFSKVVSYGNEADINLCDFLEYLETDVETNAIAIYLEGIKEGRRFFDIANKIGKPIVIIKSGRSEAGKSAALSHTGSLAGDYEIFKAAMNQCKVTVVETISQLIDVAEALSWQKRCEDGIAVLTNGGGLGVLTMDYFEELGVALVKPNTETIKRMEKIAQVGHASVLDLLGDALSDRYALGLELLLKQSDVNGVIVIETPQIMTEHDKNAKIIVDLHKKYPTKPIICCFVGGKTSKNAIEYLENNKIPNYSDTRRAVKAMRALIKK